VYKKNNYYHFNCALLLAALINSIAHNTKGTFFLKSAGKKPISYFLSRYLFTISILTLNFWRE